MVIYGVCTTYQLLEAIVHKINYHSTEKGLLLISNWLQNQYDNYLDLETFFCKVIVFDGGYTYEEAVNGGLNRRFHSLLRKEKIDLNDAAEIHVFGVEHAFGAFIELNHYPYFFWEEGAGAISKIDNMFEIFKKTHGEKKAQFQMEHHLSDGGGASVQGIYYDKFFQLKELNNTKLLHFDLGEELRVMKHSSREKIIDIFCGMTRFDISDNSALILTEHLADCSIMRWDEQKTLYQYLVDYFLSEYNIIFKPHPTDLMDYENIFPHAKVIRKRFPSELLPFVFYKTPDCVATSSSTGIYGLRKLFKKCVEFNFAFTHEKQFYDLNKFFVAISLADNYIRKGYNLHLAGVNKCIIDNFQNNLGLANKRIEMHNTVESTGGTPAIWIVDQVDDPYDSCRSICNTLSNALETDIFIFINSKKDYCFYSEQYKALWENIYPIEIVQKTVKEKPRANVFFGPQAIKDSIKYIYIYSRKESFNMVNMEQKLPNVGATVTAQGFSDKDLKIKLLEGMLDATEKRLLHYINLEKQLRNELEEKMR